MKIYLKYSQYTNYDVLKLVYNVVKITHIYKNDIHNKLLRYKYKEKNRFTLKQDYTSSICCLAMNYVQLIF